MQPYAPPPTSGFTNSASTHGEFTRGDREGEGEEEAPFHKGAPPPTHTPHPTPTGCPPTPTHPPTPPTYARPTHTHTYTHTYVTPTPLPPIPPPIHTPIQGTRVIFGNHIARVNEAKPDNMYEVAHPPLICHVSIVHPAHVNYIVSYSLVTMYHPLTYTYSPPPIGHIPIHYKSITQSPPVYHLPPMYRLSIDPHLSGAI